MTENMLGKRGNPKFLKFVVELQESDEALRDAAYEWHMSRAVGMTGPLGLALRRYGAARQAYNEKWPVTRHSDERGWPHPHASPNPDLDAA